MDPQTMLIIGRRKAQELQEEADRYRLVSQLRPEHTHAIRTIAGNALIGLGQRLLVGGHVIPSAR